MTKIFLMFLALASYAGTYNQTVSSWPIRSTTGPGTTIGHSIGVIDCSGEDADLCPFYGDQVVWPALAAGPGGTWVPWTYMSGGVATPYVNCVVLSDSASGRVGLGLAYLAPSTTGIHPGTTGAAAWPPAVKCDVIGVDDFAGETGHVVVTLTDYPDPNGPSEPLSLMSLTSIGTVTLDRVGAIVESGDIIDYTLPAGSYVSATIQCKKTGGANWPGVKLTVLENTTVTDRARLEVGAIAPAGTGYCPVSRTGLPVSNAALTLVRE
ncbi:MAG: hypothetical protein HOP09_14775 [Hyphomicrobium sp.]|nr:hypothetical protein [Hyphomicrobium sp.]